MPLWETSYNVLLKSVIPGCGNQAAEGERRGMDKGRREGVECANLSGIEQGDAVIL